MARNLTAATNVDAIDVVETAGAIVASAVDESAFMPNLFSASGPRKRLWTKRGSMTWVAQGSEGVAPDATAYAPTGVTTTNTVQTCDAILTQEALHDAETSGTPLQEQVRAEGATAYAAFLDGLCAALYSTILSTGADHVIGSSTSALTAPLIDEAIEKLLVAKPPGIDRLALIIYTKKIREFFQIPGMRDKAVRGQAGPGGVAGPDLGIVRNRRQIVAGYGDILDVYHSDQIKSSTGYHNIMLAVGSNPASQAAMVNPWSPVINANGRAPGKMNVDVVWNAAERSVDVDMTTIEAVTLRDSATVSSWAVDLVTA